MTYDAHPIELIRFDHLCAERHLAYECGWRSNGDYFVEVRDPNAPSGFDMEGKPASAVIGAALTAAARMGSEPEPGR